MYDFITVGGTTRDISFFTDQGLVIDNHRDLLRQQVLAFELGAKIKVDNFYYSHGGGAANSAVCLANFDFKAACLAPVGDDQNGQLIIKNLKSRGVLTGLVKKIKGQQSGSSFILISSSGERIIFAQRGANSHLKISAKDKIALRAAKNIYIASLAGDWRTSLVKIFAGVTKEQKVFWNPGLTQILAGLEGLEKFLKKVTVLAINQDEATELVVRSAAYKKKSRAFLDDPANLLRVIQSAGPDIVMITRGPDGVMVYDGKKIYNRPVKKEKKRVDSTGVGDIFNSSFAAGFHYFNGDIPQALDLALKNAAAKVAHLGAQDGLLDKRALKK